MTSWRSVAETPLSPPAELAPSDGEITPALGPPLAQQVPQLVQVHLQFGHAGARLVGVLAAVAELVLLLDQRVDAAEDVGLVHADTLPAEDRRLAEDARRLLEAEKHVLVQPYLLKIFHMLGRSGLVEAQAGPHVGSRGAGRRVSALRHRPGAERLRVEAVQQLKSKLGLVRA